MGSALPGDGVQPTSRTEQRTSAAAGRACRGQGAPRSVAGRAWRGQGATRSVAGRAWRGQGAPRSVVGRAWRGQGAPRGPSLVEPVESKAPHGGRRRGPRIRAPRAAGLWSSAARRATLTLRPEGGMCPTLEGATDMRNATIRQIRRLLPGGVAVSALALTIGTGGAVGAATVGLPPGQQVNDDPAAGIDPTLSISGEDPTASDVAGGAVTAGAA